MKYQKAINIWNMSDSEIKKLQSGQWVYGDNVNNKGMFLGMKKSGTIVVAWLGNASQQKSYKGYIKALSNYAKAV
jgi:hypothetical protein